MIVEPKWFYCNETDPKLGKKRKRISEPTLQEPQHKAQKTLLTGVPRSGEVECADGGIIVDIAEKETPDTDSMDIDTPGTLIVREEVDGAHADTDDTHLETTHCERLEALTLLTSPEQDEMLAIELLVAQAKGLPGIVSEETIRNMGKEMIRIVGRETINASVGGKKAKAGTKTKDIDDYLKLFMNTHRLPCNRHCRCIHSNHFFSNHSAYIFQCSTTFHSFFSVKLNAPKDCCARCKTVHPTVCCDLCNPDAILRIIPGLTVIIIPPKATRKPKQIKVPPYDSSMAEQRLKHDLLTWCKLFGNIDYFSPNIFLHSSTLECILKLAHTRKLNSVLNLKNQTL